MFRRSSRQLGGVVLLCGSSLRCADLSSVPVGCRRARAAAATRAAARTILRYPIIRNPPGVLLTDAGGLSLSRRTPSGAQDRAASWRFPIGVIRWIAGHAAGRRSCGSGRGVVGLNGYLTPKDDAFQERSKIKSRPLSSLLSPRLPARIFRQIRAKKCSDSRGDNAARSCRRGVYQGQPLAKPQMPPSRQLDQGTPDRAREPVPDQEMPEPV